MYKYTKKNIIKMIFTLKNKEIQIYIDESNRQISSDIEMCNTSLNFSNNITFVSLFDDSLNITDFEVSVDDGLFKIAYKDGTTPNFNEANIVDDGDIRLSDNNSKQIRKWNLFIFSDTVGLFKSKMRVSYKIDGTQFDYVFDVKCEVIGIENKYVILTQNMKFKITNDYYNAFRQSEHSANGIDERLMNEKRKEFLIDYFKLTSNVGTYSALLSALHYFGYGDLLSIKEIWKGEDKYATTDTNSEVLDNIDKRLIGLKKTNQLQLVYKINQWDNTYDSDGFQNFINVLFDTEEILIKMYALKRVLEKDFLPLNTKIVDIIGEHTSIAGIDAKVWTNHQRIDDIDLNEQTDNTFEFELSQKIIEVNEHEVLLRNKHFITTDSPQYVGEYPTGTVDSNLDDTFFEIDKVLEYDLKNSDDYNDLFDDNDFVERYDRSDFGLVSISVSFDSTKYSRWHFEILEDDVSVYKSSLNSISSLSDNKIVFGIRKIGKFKVMVYLYDYYGGVTIINPNNSEFDIIMGNIDFKLSKIDRSDGGELRGLDFWSTYPTLENTNRIVEIDCFDSSLNVNTFNRNTHTNLILGYNKENYDLRTLQLNSFQFNNIPLNELDKTVLTDFGYEYGRYIVDLICDGDVGLRELRIKEFEHEENWESVSLLYDPSTYPTKEHFYNDFIKLIHEKQFKSDGTTDSTWKRFTALLQDYSTSDIVSKVPVLRLTSIDEGFSIDDVIIEYNLNNPIVNVKEDIYTLMSQNTHIKIFPKLSTFSGDLKINDIVIPNIVFNSLNDIKTTLKTQFDINNLNVHIFEYNDYLILSSMIDLEISHETFGILKDVARGSESTRLKQVSSGDKFYKGEPFYAFIDTKTLIDGADYKWTLRNALNGEVVDIQNTLVYRNMISESGSYTLELESKSSFGDIKLVKNGFVIIE